MKYLPDAERHVLADDLNRAWEILRRVPGGSEGTADACLEAAQFIRPADSKPATGESENLRTDCEWCEGDTDLCDGMECQK